MTAPVDPRTEAVRWLGYGRFLAWAYLVFGVGFGVHVATLRDTRGELPHVALGLSIALSVSFLAVAAYAVLSYLLWRVAGHPTESETP